MELIVGEIYSGEEVNDIEGQNANFDITRLSCFKLVEINKSKLYDKNLITKNQWLEDSDNYDFYHTNLIDWMITELKENKDALPPLVVDKNGFLQDGTHRLSALHEISEVVNILVFKEIEPRNPLGL